MTVSRTRWSIIRVVGAAPSLAPALCGAQQGDGDLSGRQPARREGDRPRREGRHRSPSYLRDIGEEHDAKVGDWVVAVGNPFGLGGSGTAEIISAFGRDIKLGPYDDFLPNRRADQPPQLRRTELQSSRPGDRHQYRDLFGFGRIGAPAKKASSRPAQGTLARQPPLSSANLAVCDGDRAVAASPDGRPPARYDSFSVCANRIDTARRCHFRSALRASAANEGVACSRNDL